MTSSSAPAAVNTIMRQGVSFAGNQGNLVMRGKIALLDVGTGAAGQTGCLQDYNTNVARGVRLSVGQLVALGTSGASYVFADQVSPALDLISSAFTRYRVKRMKFIYAPQSTTNTVNRITFAYASDPLHPSICPATAAVTTPEGMEGLADSIVFAPWMGWELDVSKSLPKDWLFTCSTNGDVTNGNEASRFEFFGAVGGVITPSSAGASRYGTLYQEFEIEFKEFCPISTVRPTSLSGIPREVISNFIRMQKGSSAQGEIGEGTRISSQVDESSRSNSLLVVRDATTIPPERSAGRACLLQSSLSLFPSPDKEVNKEESSETLTTSGIRSFQSLEEIEEIIKDSWPHLSADEHKEILQMVVRCRSPKDGERL